MTRRPDPIPTRGRRTTILYATRDAPQRLSRIADQVRAQATARGLEPSINQLKTTAAVRDLRRLGLIARTVDGWRATPAGVALLNASQAVDG